MENLTKRMKNAIVQEFIFHTTICILFIVGILFYIIPTQAQIGEKISLLQTVNTNFSTIQVDGISFGDFYEGVSQNLGSNPYMRTLLTQIDETFYTKNFQNLDKTKSFLMGIEEKKQSLEVQKKSENYTLKADTISDILPTYSFSSQSEDTTLSDFDFVNNLEELLFSFNLVSNDPIGIGNIQVVGSSTTQELPIKEGSKIGTSIYSFPVNLDLTGQKKDILDFLHYLENVGSIKIQQGDLTIYKDTVLSQFQSNIYKNQFIDIESLVMRNYIDTSPERANTDFISFIKSTQGREKFSVELSLRFYASGFPKYKLESEIENIIKNSKSLQGSIIKSIKDYQAISTETQEEDVISTINQIKSLNLLMIPLVKDVASLQVDLASPQQDIEVLYKKTQGLREKVEKIKQHYNKNISLLEKIK